MAKAGQASTRSDETVRVEPASMPLVGTVDERYQSYNVEMLEVTGGRFWRPYSVELFAVLEASEATATEVGGDAEAEDYTPSGMNPALYEYLPPIDLGNPRLRKLAAALAPTYMRVSGTWANTTCFTQSEDAPTAPPEGYGGVLTGKQWRGVVEFAQAVGAGIVTSMPISAGTRDASGAWTPDQARTWLAYTRSIGGEIAAAEFMNEPTLAAMGGAPEGYDAKAYGHDFQTFLAFAKAEAPGMIVLGPGSVGETAEGSLVNYGQGFLRTDDLLEASGPGIEAFSFHHYGAVSIRCRGVGPQTSAEEALSEHWLARTDETLAFYRQLRDEFAPGAPLWNTETAETACGGNPWARTFLDTFRYLDQLGRNAKEGLQVHIHNTLAASDYALLDAKSFAPRPSYWAALLWRRLMGVTVLDAGVPIQQGLHFYAHGLRDVRGGVALLVINSDPVRPRSFSVAVTGQRYTLSSPQLQSEEILLNGEPLALGSGDELPNLVGVETEAGVVALAPATITFLALPSAGNPACS